MKDYDDKQRGEIAEAVLRQVRALLTTDELKSYAGLVIARWFAEDDWRPWHPEKGRSLVNWVALVVRWKLRDRIRTVSGSRRARALNIHPVASIEITDETDHTRPIEAREEIARLLAIARATPAQVETVLLMAMGFKPSDAARVRGVHPTAGIQTFNNFKRRLSQCYQLPS